MFKSTKGVSLTQALPLLLWQVGPGAAWHGEGTAPAARVMGSDRAAPSSASFPGHSLPRQPALESPAHLICGSDTPVLLS